MNPDGSYKYQVGGSLEKNAPTYVERQADRAFCAALRAGEFCYVFNSRQMGKSSLRVHTMQALQAGGVACGVIDITSIGSQGITPDQWYQGVVRRLARSFGVKAMGWWREHAELSPVQRLGEFIEEVLLQEVTTPMVIFIDEIDSILRLEFKDDFFALIRACYNQRAENSDYKRLTFALLGVTTPSDLIQDKNRTPFNIGQAIDLHGFELEEVGPLAVGLTAVAAAPTEVMAAILNWTGGQPLLTQKLCRLVVNEAQPIAVGEAETEIASLVERRILTNWEAQDEPEHLRTIRDRLLRDERMAGRLLGLYQQILREGSIVATGDPAQIELRLSGLVVEDRGRLRVYNPIYGAVFDQAWVQGRLAELRPYGEAIAAWIVSDYTDDSRLLVGQALEAAQAWAMGKSLGQVDYRFLTESEKQDKRAIQAANQILADANTKARRRLVLSGAGAGIATVMAGIALFGFFGAEAQRTKAEEKLDLAETQRAAVETERDAVAAERAQLSEELGAAENEKIEIQQQVKGLEAEKQTLADEKAEIEQQSGEASRQRQRAEVERQEALAAQQIALSRAQRAQQDYAEAQQAAETAQQRRQEAAAEVAKAQQEQAKAQLEQEIAREGGRLERQGNALMRLQPVRFRELATLIKAIEIGEGLQALIKQADSPSSSLSLSDYPAISPLLALRVATNAVSQRTKFAGEFRAFSADGQRLVAYSRSDETTYLYDLAGNRVGQFAGEFRAFSADGQRLVAYSLSDDTTYLYDLAGNQVRQFAGYFRAFSADGQRLVAYSLSDDTNYLHDLAGNRVGQFAGEFRDFSADGQRLVAYSESDDTNYLYDLVGNQVGQFAGEFRDFSADGQRLVAYSRSDATTYLYDLSNNVFSQFKFDDVGMSPTGNRLVAYSRSDDTTYLYDLAGNRVGQFAGEFRAFSADGQRLVAYSLSDDTTYLYDLAGNQVRQFAGYFRAFSADGQRLVAYSLSDDTTYLYDLAGNQVRQFA
ncbi:AAA-like domain-containing protein, partial [Sphaerothrix gracilis]|uniref:AAA-like domain-containing protein n=1 Tax=Sphaerothrix gracilis TaxID=3151835 RepID=UPI0031FDBF59